MRLHHLELSGFGPYPRSESVDFDTLGADGLFLLHGDTGAGKTTLLDAVAFALFGAVPGARGEAKRLRCDTAGGDAPTEVTLELTVAGQRLRLCRSPEYERPKKRGDGTTKQQAKASLVWLDAPEREPLTRLDEVSTTVHRLLGLNAEQFFQVVLLPQGEFARFLRAETSEREKLLTKLFATERFGDVERWFSERRVDRGRRRDRARQRAQRDAARLAQAAGEEPPAEDAPVEPEWIETVRCRCDRESDESQRVHTAAAAESDAEQQRLAGTRARAEQVRRLRAAREELAELESRSEQRASAAAELERARRAVPVLAARRARDRAAEHRAAAGSREEERRKALERLDVVAKDVATMRSEAARYREQAGELSALVTLAAEQDADTARLQTLDEELASLDKQLTERHAKAAELPDRTAAAREELAAAQDAAARAESLAAAVRQCAEPHEAALALPAARQVVEDARHRHQAAVGGHQQARERVLDLRARRLDGMAAELAGDLSDGAACPVCGSAEHPAPAAPAGDPVSEAAEREAAETETASGADRERAAAELREAEQRLADLTERAGEQPVEQLAAQLERARDEQRRAAELAELRPERQRSLAAAEQAESELRAETERLAQRQAAAHAERDGIAERVSGRAERLESGRGEHESVEARRSHLLAVAEACENAAEASAEHRSARDRYDEQHAALAEAIGEAGFPSEEDAVAAGREDGALAELERWMAEYDRRRAAASAVTVEPELAGIDPATEVDVAAAERVAAEARERADAALVRSRAAVRRAADVAAIAGELSERLAELAPLEAEYAELDALTDVINGRGQNSKRMSLRSYVLAARLEQVAISATRRLRAMTGGRYSFEHSDAKGARGTRGGLGIEVRDDYSGCLRSAKTLSGGESFLASLALALGLADVVTAETGAAQLDTLFIDEGFGSLDADTLESVMDALDELRAGGRVVGLVSHVEEMRQRIPMRLRVRKSRAGSTLELDAR